MVAGALVLAALLPACQGAPTDDPTPSFSITDSAGVAVVDNRRPDIQLTPREFLRLGVVEGDPRFQFYRVLSVAADSAGDVWVSDSNESIRHYGPDGAFLGSVGGEGEGPGEARSFTSLRLGDGTVAAMGSPVGPQFFLSDGTFLGSREGVLRDPSNPGWQGVLLPMAQLDDRWVFTLEVALWDQPTGSSWQGSMAFLVGGALDDPLDTVAVLPAERLTLVEGRTNRASILLGNPAFGADRQGRVYATDAMDYRIESRDLQGKPIRVLTRTVAPRGFDPAWLADLETGVDALYATEYGGRILTSSQQAERERLIAAAWPDVPPEHLPFIEDLWVGPDGWLWVLRGDQHPRPGARAAAHAFGFIRIGWLPEWKAPYVFDVFDPRGEYQGTVELPLEFTPMSSVGARMYGVLRDEMDVEYVVAFEAGQ